MLGKIANKNPTGEEGAKRSLFAGITPAKDQQQRESPEPAITVALIGAKVQPPQTTKMEGICVLPVVGYINPNFDDKKPDAELIMAVDGTTLKRATIYATMPASNARKIYDDSQDGHLDPAVPVTFSNLERKTKAGIYSAGLISNPLDGEFEADTDQQPHVYETAKGKKSSVNFYPGCRLKTKKGKCRALKHAAPVTYHPTVYTKNQFINIQPGTLFSIAGVFLEGDGFTSKMTAKNQLMYEAKLTVFDQDAPNGRFVIPIMAFNLAASPDVGPNNGTQLSDFLSVTLFNLKKTVWAPKDYHQAVFVERTVYVPSTDTSKYNDLIATNFDSIVDGLAYLADQVDVNKSFIAPFFAETQTGPPISGWCSECGESFEFDVDRPGKCENGHDGSLKFKIHLQCTVTATVDGKKETATVPIQADHNVS